MTYTMTAAIDYTKVRVEATTDTNIPTVEIRAVNPDNAEFHASGFTVHLDKMNLNAIEELVTALHDAADQLDRSAWWVAKEAGE
jgi:hypothetical protein